MNLYLTDENEMSFHPDEVKISDQIIDYSRSMISIINRQYVYEKVNSAFCDAHQLVKGSIVGKSLGEVWGNDIFQDKIKSNIDTCFSGNTVRYEAFFDTPESGKRYFEVIFRPLSLKEGEITHLMAETFDIHDLRQSMQKAVEKEEELRKFETNLPIGFLRCDPSGNILHCNRAFSKIMDCSDESSLRKMNLKSFFHEPGLFEILAEQLIDNNEKSFGRVRLVNFHGAEIHCRLSGFMDFNDRGEQSFIDFAVEDSSRELMLETRLIQAQKLETIGALAGGIAHDFNNILATISGYSEMLYDDLPKDSDLVKKVTKIQIAVQKAQSITNQILTFSRQVDQEKVQVSVSKVLKETIGFVKSAIPAKILIKSNISVTNSNVFTDPTQLFRVFLNLMTNAIQAMEENGGTLTVSLTVVEGKHVKNDLNRDFLADEYVLVSFADTGTGMDPSLLSRIFEPFFTTREVGKGTGLGLSVIHGIITEMEGEILVSSRKDEGSVFQVFLPVTKNYPEPENPDVKKKRILFLAGNKYESRILSLALENAGFELIFTSDYTSLIKILSNTSGRPDLIIYMSDSPEIHQEDIMGIYSTLGINTPCILISEPNKVIIKEKFLNSGIIKQQLIKPVSLKEIRNAIQSLLIRE